SVPGARNLVDELAARGRDCLAMLDVPGAALDRAKARLGTTARMLIWVEADAAREWSLKPWACGSSWTLAPRRASASVQAVFARRLPCGSPRRRRPSAGRDPHQR